MPRLIDYKRRVLVAGALSAAAGLSPAHGASFAQKATMPADLNAMRPLIHVLKASMRPVCIDAAQELGAIGAHTQHFDLHLRGALLDAHDAKALAHALHVFAKQSALRLRSFSASYNPGIGDIAASALLAALPSDLVELGLVGCCLTDRSGEEALHFMLRSTGLKVMCVEDNDFSQTMKARIEQAGLSLAGCLLVV